MQPTLFLAVIAMILVYGGLNYYIGRHGWQAFGPLIGPSRRWWYWGIFWCAAFSFFLAQFTQNFLPRRLSYLLSLSGGYWLGALYYLIMLLIIVDCLRFFGRRTGLLPAVCRQPQFRPIFGIIVVGLVVGLLMYGTWNAQHPVVRHYDLTIPKSAGQLDKLHIVVVSDLHLGTIVDNRRLTKMVKLVNAQQPDLVLLPGDIIDEDLNQFMQQHMAATFRHLRPPLGIYASLGNHELFNHDLTKVIEVYRSAGITVLRDQKVKVDDSFYLVGRVERNTQRMGAGRAKLADLLQGTARDLPVIVLDHEPVDLAEAAKAGADLQLSGHTHDGQFWPNQLITGLIYEDDWGYLRKDGLQVIVSDGYGTWGPPLRIGNRPEIIDLVVHFHSPDTKAKH